MESDESLSLASQEEKLRDYIDKALKTLRK